MRTRYSLAKEDRCVALWQQGHTYREIAEIVNGSVSGVRLAIARWRKRWKHDGDPKCGRTNSFLSDAQIEAIHDAYRSGLTQYQIGCQYGIEQPSVSRIVMSKTYQCSEDTGYPFDFSYRPARRLL